MRSTPRSDGSQTLERGLRALATLADNPEGMTASEVAWALGVHRSIAYRLLTTLLRVGYVDRDGDARYRVGVGLLTLADRARPRLRQVATSVLAPLAAQLQATTTLVEVIGEHAVPTVVEDPPTTGPYFSYGVGHRDPLERGSGGLAALASGPPRDDEPSRVTETRERGHVTTHSEIVPGAYGIAAPVQASTLARLSSINVITHRADVAETAVGPVMSAARDIAHLLDQGR